MREQISGGEQEEQGKQEEEFNQLYLFCFNRKRKHFVIFRECVFINKTKKKTKNENKKIV